MSVSIIIPACGAQAFIARAVSSVIAQAWSVWEAIIVADDDCNYRDWLGAQGVEDRRLRFASTGSPRSGCHAARNVGIAAARGEFVAMLDADDFFHPCRLEKLVPVAREWGAATDNVEVVCEESGRLLYRVLDGRPGYRWLTLPAFLELTAPLFPLVRADHLRIRRPGVEHAEDVANMCLIDRIGPLPVVSSGLMQYRVRAGSICHGSESAAAFDLSYASLIARLQDPSDGLGLSPASREYACRGLIAKRNVNRAFKMAQQRDSGLNFQSFVADAAASHV